ncbi:MAG: DEAD/DEAH box helicase [Phycisphaerae bacterium]
MDSKNFQRFEDFDLSKKLQEAVLEARLERPTELQKEVIPLVLADRDVIFEARSGMGKSACFAIPFLQHWLRDRMRKAIIITPTSDTVQQLAKVIGRLCPILKARVLKFTRKDDYFYPEFHEKCPIVILELAVAERFIKREKEFVANIRSLGLDELDRLMAHENELETLVHSISTDRQTLICANELTEQVLEKGRWFCDPNRLEKVKLSRPETQWSADHVKLQYVLVSDEKRFDQLVETIAAQENTIALVVTDSDRISRFLIEKFVARQLPAELLEYSMQLDAKQTLVDQVAAAGKGVLVGCDAALNGLNLPKINHLISWELPSQLENYWKRLDRFAYQGEFAATVLVDQPRAAAVRILERHLGRPLTCLNKQAAGPDRARREPAMQASRPAKTDKDDYHPAPPPVKTPFISTEIVIPERFHLPVFARRDELARFAPEGVMKKTLGSKFMPARAKKKSKEEKE